MPGWAMSLNFGWQRENIIEFMEMIYDNEFTAKTLATILLDECNKLYGYQPGDDTTVCADEDPPAPAGKPDDRAAYRPGRRRKDDGDCSFPKRASTSSAAARLQPWPHDFLHKPVQPNLGYLDPEIPPTATIEGVDLVTEGVITINRVLEYAQRLSGR